MKNISKNGIACFRLSKPAKTCFSLFIFLLLVCKLQAQFTASYAFTQTAGTYTALSGATVIHATTWNDPAPVAVTIPFNFNFDNVNYTSCSVNGNGYLTFGATISAAAGYTPISAATAYAGTVSALGLNLLSNGAVGSDISYGTTGISPNRVFTVQWTNCQRSANNAAGTDWNFQIQLCETSNVVKVVYGACAATNTTNTVTAQVGLRGPNNTDYNNRWQNTPGSWLSSMSGIGWANNFTMITRNTSLPASGTTYTWTPPVYPLNSCNPAGNVIIYSNYDGGALTINVDQNIPNLKIGICSYEAVQVTITGTYVGNVTAVRYAGYIGTNNHCATGTAMTITGVSAGIVTIAQYPAATMTDPNGSANMVCAYQCTAGNNGGCNTAGQVSHYFLTYFGGSLRQHMMQYGCWTTTQMVSAGGNCCLINQVLPVELTGFWSSCDARSNAELHWETASETNNHFFTVERSVNGSNFTAIGTVNGNGTSSQPHSYSFTDTETPDKPCYYRLRQTDYNGQNEVFSIHSFDRSTCSDGYGELKGWPNPSASDFYIQFYAEEETELVITWTDMSGRIVLQENKTNQQGWNTYNTDISQLPAGAYSLHVNGNIKLKENHLLVIKSE